MAEMGHEDMELDGVVALYRASKVSFDDIYQRLQPLIRRLAVQEANAVVRLRPFYDRDDYESILRVALWRSLDGWVEGRARFMAYFLRAARYEVRNAVRRETAMRRDGNYNNVSLNEEFAEESKRTELDPAIRRVEFLDALNCLPLSPNERRICIELLAGYSQREVARRHGWTEQYVSMTLRRMRGKFRQGGTGVVV
jgi:RNA polymerase sigma factor (sigma-70 family)